VKEEDLPESQGLDGNTRCLNMLSNCSIPRVGVQRKEIGVTGERNREAIIWKQTKKHRKKDK
jgi:hypothetical protein